MIAEPVDSRRALVARAQAFAERHGDSTVTTTHLLFAVMAASETIWPKRIVERGGLTLELALRRLHWPTLGNVSSEDVRRYRVSMRLTVIIVVSAGFLAIVRRLRLRVVPVPRPALDRAAADADVGLLLLALATTPGRHLRLVDNATVLACAARRELGLDRWHHRLILGLDWPRLLTRRARAWLVAGVSKHGRMSWWGLGLLVFRAIGLVSALVFFFLTVPATVFLYLFLWPALILTTAVRTAVCAFAHLETRVHKWYEIPGGEIGLAGPGERVDARRLAAAILIPRVVAFAFCVSALVFVGWRSQRLGVALFPSDHRSSSCVALKRPGFRRASRALARRAPPGRIRWPSSVQSTPVSPFSAACKRAASAPAPSSSSTTSSRPRGARRPPGPS